MMTSSELAIRLDGMANIDRMLRLRRVNRAALDLVMHADPQTLAAPKEYWDALCAALSSTKPPP